MRIYAWNSPVNLATPLKVMSSIITGSERPFAFTAKRINLYELVDSRLSIKKDTGGLCVQEQTQIFIWNWNLNEREIDRDSHRVSDFWLIWVWEFPPFRGETFAVSRHQSLQCTQHELCQSIDLTPNNFAMQTDVLWKKREREEEMKWKSERERGKKFNFHTHTHTRELCMHKWIVSIGETVFEWKLN